MANEPDERIGKTQHGNVVCEPAAGGIAIAKTLDAGVVVDGVDPATGDHTITADVDGACSTSRLKEDGTVSLNLEGSPTVGRRGEPRVIRTLRQRLHADGHTTSVSTERERDKWGEDGILTIDGARYVLQVVTAPRESAFWWRVSAGAAIPEVNEAGAVNWIREAIESKARKIPPRERPRTVLALHAQHAGILADARIVGAYLHRFKTPRHEFQFSAVWVVGPTVARCIRVGD